VKERIQQGNSALEEFIITKSLTKHPQDYPDKKNLPHVQVAMRMMSNDVRVQAGDVIPYIICKVYQFLLEYVLVALRACVVIMK